MAYAGTASCGPEPRIYRRPLAFARGRLRQAVGLGATLATIKLRERPRALQFATVYDAALGPTIRRYLGWPYIVYAYGNEILDILRPQAWHKPRLGLECADRVIACSNYTADLVRQAGVPEERIEVIAPGCDSTLFAPRTPPFPLVERLLQSRRGTPTLLTVGTLVPRKGHDMVIKAMGRLGNSVPDLTYLIVGTGPYQGELERLAIAEGLRDRVIFAGHVPTSQLPDVYSICDVFVMPSRSRYESQDVEGFGIVFLEANACGKPVIGGRSGGIPDAIAEKETGLLVDPEDPGSIADAISLLLRDNCLAQQLGREGRARVVRSFSWSQTAERIQAVIEAVVAEQRYAAASHGA